MEAREVHSFHLHSEKEFSEIQDKLIHRIELKNNFHLEDVSLIAGVDLAYWEKDDKHYGTCCIVVIEYHTKKEVEKVYSYGEVTVPYIPGFLAFRELPLVIEAAKSLLLIQIYLCSMEMAIYTINIWGLRHMLLFSYKNLQSV